MSMQYIFANFLARLSHCNLHLHFAPTCQLQLPLESKQNKSLSGLTFALEGTSLSALTPFLLHESRAAFLALIAASVMFARAEKTVPVRVQFVTHVRVTVANATTADRDVLHRVVVLWVGGRKG